MTVSEEKHKIEKRRAAAILALVGTVALTIAAGALAGRGEPQEKITAVDQARAVAMLPRAVAQETAAYRLRYADVNGPANVDFVFLGHSRAAVQVVLDDPLHVGGPDVRDAEVDLARIIAPRMARVMGGG